MKIERRKIADLYTDPANARVHGPKNMETIKASLRRFGQQHPLVVNEDGMVVAGNGRLVAMGDLGWTECDVVVTDLTGLDLAAFGVADNRTAELAEWDRDALAVVLEALKADDDLAPEDAGFDEATMAETLAALEPEQPDEPKEVVEDEAPEPEEDAVTQPGDLWVLGDHRVLCGDSTDAGCVERVTGGEVVDAVVTDPPYGIGLDTDYSRMGRSTKSYAPIAGDEDGEVAAKALSAISAPVMYVWGGDHLASAIPNWRRGSLVVWAKAHSEEENAVFGSAFEVCWRTPPGKKEVWFVRRIQMTSERLGVHPTQKPVECMARPIRNHDAALVYDPFLGSGTTLIAAEQLGRRCVGLELEPRYVDVIVRRWQALTGKAAILDGTDQTFAEIEEARA